MPRAKSRNQEFPLKENDVVIYRDYKNQLLLGAFKNNHISDHLTAVYSVYPLEARGTSYVFTGDIARVSYKNIPFIVSQYNWKNITKEDFLESARLNNMQMTQEDIEYLHDWYDLSPEEKDLKFEISKSSKTAAEE